MVISITPKEFLKLMTKQEVINIQKSNIDDVIYLRTIFLASERVRGDDKDLVESLPALQALGLLSADTVMRIKSALLIK